jgi:hypothetical protein
MKNLTFCFFAVLLVLAINFSSFAKPVDGKTALIIAKGKLSEIDHNKKFTVLNQYEIKNDQNYTSFFIFTLKPTGFIIITADDDLPPVISYSIENEIGEIDAEKNPLLSLLLYDIQLRLNAIALLPAKFLVERHQLWKDYLNNNIVPSPDFQQWPPAGSTPTGGWLETNWTQNSPYNALCPLDGGGIRSLVGCPATTMAQILNYHKTINSVVFTDADDYYHSYGSGNQYWIDNDYVPRQFPSFPQLNAYLATLQQHYDNNITLTNTDKAALSFACGVAAKQVFRSDGSGTFGVSQARDAYIKFNCNTSQLLTGTDTSIYTRMSVNMKNALPAHLAVVNQAWTVGHNVVVDGFNTNNYYHVNFGWGGSYNNWYLIPQELPYSLTVIEGVIVDILKPAVGLPENPENVNDCILIYPNPVKDKLNILINDSNISNFTINIYTITGQTVYRDFQKNKHLVIDVSNYSKGVYFVNIICDHAYKYKKIVID